MQNSIMRLIRSFVFIAILNSVIFGRSQFLGAGEAPSSQSIEQRVNERDQTINILNRKQELQEEKSAATAKDAPVYILDDSLSAVDTKTERIILKNLRGIRNKTTVIISHRLSVVQHADEILVLEGGRIIERGNHSELIKFGGLYFRLWCMQSGLRDGAESIESGVTEKTGFLQPGLTENIESIQSSVTEEEAV